MKLNININKLNHRDAKGIELTVNNHTFEFRKKYRFEDNRAYWWKSDKRRGQSKAFLPLPLKLCISGFREDKTYAELVNVPDLTVDWIIDEFDASFNKLAVASMQYHLNHAITIPTQHKRETFNALIRRFETLQDIALEGITKEEYNNFGKGDTTPEVRKRVLNAILERDKKIEAAEIAVREDFLKIVPYLWS